MHTTHTKIFKIFAILICFLLCFEQSGFAQVATQLDIAGHLGAMHNALTTDRFRPLHLRYLQYLPEQNSFRLLIDKGDFQSTSGSVGTGFPARLPEARAGSRLNSLLAVRDKPVPTANVRIEEESKILLKYFFIGLSLPNDAFWVNLRPDSPDNIIDPLLAQTDIGKILLEADVQLKKDTAQATSPDTPEGRVYWDKLYQKAGELFGSENITIPTLTRPWIVPDEIIIRETTDSAYIYKATLKVMLEEDYLNNNNRPNASVGTAYYAVPTIYTFKDDRLKELNVYSSQLIRELIIPKLTKEVNTSKRYAQLRQVYYSLILASWFKARRPSLPAGQMSPQSLRGADSSSSLRSREAAEAISNLIDSRNLTNLTSKEFWSQDTYFNAYKENFAKGEYNIREPVYTPYGQTIRSYFSGGIANLAYSIPPSGQIDPTHTVSLIPAQAGLNNQGGSVTRREKPSFWGRVKKFPLLVAAGVLLTVSRNNTNPTEVKIRVETNINNEFIPIISIWAPDFVKKYFNGNQLLLTLAELAPETRMRAINDLNYWITYWKNYDIDGVPRGAVHYESRSIDFYWKFMHEYAVLHELTHAVTADDVLHIDSSSKFDVKKTFIDATAEFRKIVEQTKNPELIRSFDALVKYMVSQYYEKDVVDIGIINPEKWDLQERNIRYYSAVKLNEVFTWIYSMSWYPEWNNDLRPGQVLTGEEAEIFKDKRGKAPEIVKEFLSALEDAPEVRKFLAQFYANYKLPLPPNLSMDSTPRDAIPASGRVDASRSSLELGKASTDSGAAQILEEGEMLEKLAKIPHDNKIHEISLTDPNRPSIVCIHGALGGELADFADFMKGFSEKGYNVYGFSYKEETDIAEVANRLHDEYRRFGFEKSGTVRILADSYGCSLVRKAVYDYPEGFRNVILIQLVPLEGGSALAMGINKFEPVVRLIVTKIMGLAGGPGTEVSNNVDPLGTLAESLYNAYSSASFLHDIEGTYVIKTEGDPHAPSDNLSIWQRIVLTKSDKDIFNNLSQNALQGNELIVYRIEPKKEGEDPHDAALNDPAVIKKIMDIMSMIGPPKANNIDLKPVEYRWENGNPYIVLYAGQWLIEVLSLGATCCLVVKIKRVVAKKAMKAMLSNHDIRWSLDEKSRLKPDDLGVKIREIRMDEDGSGGSVVALSGATFPFDKLNNKTNENSEPIYFLTTGGAPARGNNAQPEEPPAAAARTDRVRYGGAPASEDNEWGRGTKQIKENSLALSSRRLRSISNHGILSLKDQELLGINIVETGANDYGGSDMKLGPPLDYLNVNMAVATKPENHAQVARFASYQVSYGVVQIALERVYDDDMNLLQIPEDQARQIFEERANNSCLFIIDVEKINDRDRGYLLRISGKHNLSFENYSYGLPISFPIPAEAIVKIVLPVNMEKIVKEAFPSVEIIIVKNKIKRDIDIQRADPVKGEGKGRLITLSVPDYETAIAKELDGLPSGQPLVLYSVRLVAPSDIVFGEKNKFYLEGEELPQQKNNITETELSKFNEECTIASRNFPDLTYGGTPAAQAQPGEAARQIMQKIQQSVSGVMFFDDMEGRSYENAVANELFTQLDKSGIQSMKSDGWTPRPFRNTDTEHTYSRPISGGFYHWVIFGGKLYDCIGNQVSHIIDNIANGPVATTTHITLPLEAAVTGIEGKEHLKYNLPDDLAAYLTAISKYEHAAERRFVSLYGGSWSFMAEGKTSNSQIPIFISSAITIIVTKNGKEICNINPGGSKTVIINFILNNSGQVSGFKTSQGSTYTVSGSSTQRNKSQHLYHEADDVGLQTSSEHTYYVSPEAAKWIGAFRGLSGDHIERKGILVSSDGIRTVAFNKTKNAWVSFDGPDPISDTLQIGMCPIELWTGASTAAEGQIFYSDWHAGNQIVEISHVDDSLGKSAIGATGGIDFRALPIVTQAIGNLRMNMDMQAISRLRSADIRRELEDIQHMVDAGISPSGERIKECVQASSIQGNLDIDKVVSCIADILRHEEEICLQTEPVIRDILVVLESSRSSQELREIFAGKI